MSKIEYLLSKNEFGYVFTFELNNERTIDPARFSSLFDTIASDLNITGKIEVYLHDGYLLSHSQESNSRILRIGIGLKINGGDDSIQRFKSVCADRLTESITKVAHAAGLSEAATVGTIRLSLNPVLFAKYKNGARLSISKMIYH
jgi:hypothetical protein